MNLEGKNILITGAGGFIGSHLAEALVKKGAKVKCFLKYNSRGSKGLLELADLNDLEIKFGDLADIESVRKTMKGVDIVFHLGALITIPYSYENPRSFVNANIIGSLNIFQASLEEGVKKVIHTSTSEVYGTAQYTPIDEKHPLVGQSPYSATKIGADKIAESFYRSFGLPVVIARPFNTYGPRQSPRAVIPTIIIQSLNGNEIKLGNIETKRDFTYVEDTVQGFICIADNGKMGEVYNIGYGKDFSIKEIAGEVGRILGKEITIVQNEAKLRPEKSEVEILQCDNKKIKEIGWHAQKNMSDGLRETINWFKKNKEFYKLEGNFI